MPTLDQIRAALKTKITGIAGSGVVHDYERFAQEQSKFKTLYLDTAASRIHGWHIRRAATREKHLAVGRYLVEHTWHVRGFMSLDDADATEKTFDIEVEAFRDAIREDDTLGTLIASMITEEQAGAQVLDSGPVMFAGVLCHAVRMALITRHYL